MKVVLEGFNPIGVVTDFLSSKDGKAAKTAAKFLTGPQNKNGAKYLGGSISNYANDLIMTFPMLIDNSLAPDICSMLSKANERNIVAMLHLLFSSMQFNGDNGKDIIKSIYGKVNTRMSMDDYIDAVDNFVTAYKENYHAGYINHDREINRLINETVRAINECVKEGKIYFETFEETSINEKALTDYTVMKDRNDEIVVKEINGGRPNTYYRYRTGIDGKPEYVELGDVDTDKYGLYNIKPNGPMDDQGMRTANDAIYKAAQLSAQAQKRQDDLDYRAQQQKNYQSDQDYATLSRRILDGDVKKANELQPTLMIVNYNEMDPTGKIYGKKSFVCGVKSRLIPVESSDIVERIISKNRTRLSFLNFIRATTGEIGLLKDFILSLDQAKIDAKNSVKKGEAAQVWKTLEFLSNKNNLNKMRRNGNDASAITTLVVNQETVNLLKKEFKMDLEQPRVAKFLFDKYNLLGIFIVDESVEVVKTLYRGNQMYEHQAFSYLEKEENDKSYKKVINLMGQMNR